MGENTNIEWATHTFNPWVGCQRVSPGCVNCYAEAYDKRVGGLPKNQRKDPEVAELRWGPKAPRVRTSDANWRKPLAWDKAAEKAGERHRVFCSSLADVFEDRFDLEAMRLELFGLIRRTPNLDWLLLTKRPENIKPLWPGVLTVNGDPWYNEPGTRDWPNVWLGTTVEDQQRANERVPELLKVPAVVRFLSCEPLLERVELPFAPANIPIINWVIIGGESGPKARPFSLMWARDLVRQCRSAGAAPFVKQLGSRPVGRFKEGVGLRPHVFKLKDPHGGDMAEWPEDLRVREFPR